MTRDDVSSCIDFQPIKTIVLRLDYEINSCMENYPIKNRCFAARLQKFNSRLNVFDHV